MSQISRRKPRPKNKRHGRVSISLLNKHVVRDLIRGLSNIHFRQNKVCDACVRAKKTKSSFKHKKEVSTNRPLKLIHMDLYGPLKIQSRGGKKYIFIIIYDFLWFTWIIFIKSKDKIIDVLVTFEKLFNPR